MKSLDWPHVALFALTALCIAGLLFFASKTGNTALIGVVVTAAGGLLTSLIAMLRGSSAQTQVTAMRAAARRFDVGVFTKADADATTPVEVPRVPPGRNE